MKYPFIEDRKKRLESFNKILKERRLKPLNKLGDCKIKGESELLKIIAIHDHSKKYWTEIEFEVKDWTKKISIVTLRWNINSLESDGNVYVVLINEHYLLSKQHRLSMGKWKKHLPRGYHWPLPKRSSKKQLFNEIQISDVPMETLMRELGEEVVRSSEVSEVTFLGNIAQNDGQDTATPGFWFLKIDVPQDILDKRLKEISDEGVKVVLMTREEVEADIGKSDGISDALSITGIHLAERYLEQK